MLPFSIIKTCVRSQKKVLLHLGGSNSEPYHLLIPKCHVQLWELDYKEGWALKNWCFQTVLLQMTLEYPLESKIKPVNLKETQPWILFGRTDAEAEASILGPPDTNWKRPWCWERLKAEGEEGDRGWDGWIVLPMNWTWTWANSRRWWGTEKPGELQSMGSQRVGTDLVSEQQV